MLKASSNQKPSNCGGTQEWSVKTVNCTTGCSHDCRYCYAKGMAVRFKQVHQSSGHWNVFDKKMLIKLIKNSMGRSCSRRAMTSRPTILIHVKKY